MYSSDSLIFLPLFENFIYLLFFWFLFCPKESHLNFFFSFFLFFHPFFFFFFFFFSFFFFFPPLLIRKRREQLGSNLFLSLSRPARGYFYLSLRLRSKSLITVSILLFCLSIGFSWTSIALSKSFVRTSPGENLINNQYYQLSQEKEGTNSLFVNKIAVFDFFFFTWRKKWKWKWKKEIWGFKWSFNNQFKNKNKKWRSK